jgi:hypothetical protein
MTTKRDDHQGIGYNAWQLSLSEQYFGIIFRNNSGEAVMPSLVRFGAAVALLVATTSCGGPTETASTDSASPEASSSPAASGSPAVPKADFKFPMVASKPAAPLPVLARFIQPTNIDARNKQTQAEIQRQAKNNRRDPFAIPLQVQPQAQLPNGTPLQPAKPSPNAVSPQQARAQAPIELPSHVRIEPESDTAGRAFRGYPPPALGEPSRPRPRVATSPRPVAARPSKPTTPTQPSQPLQPAAPPSPTDALALKVTGVVQVGNEFKVIVQIPGENTERYVSVGDRIANGQVLVKRVELNKVLDPVVIFEQYGQEVAKNVGDTNPAIAMR